MLTLDQWDKNVCVKEGSAERVECAIRLPGSHDDRRSAACGCRSTQVPDRGLCAVANCGGCRRPGGGAGGDGCADAGLKAAAKDIADKYVDPPATTDYAIMFLATEGLYAEALRQPQFVEEMLQNYRVVIAGPTTLSAILSSLRMGFQTLTVEQRAAEVWRVLGAVKTEFGKFGGVLDRVQRQLHTVTRTIEETGTRTRVMERRLRADPSTASRRCTQPPRQRPPTRVAIRRRQGGGRGLPEYVPASVRAGLLPRRTGERLRPSPGSAW